MISIEQSNNGDSNWNNRLLDSGLGTIYQTKEMKINFENQGYAPNFLKFINETGKIVGQLLFFEGSRFRKKGYFGKILKNTPLLRKKLCQWSYGPVIFDKAYSNEVYSKLGEFLYQKNYIVSGVEHPFSPSGITAMKKQFKIIPWSTYLVDLQNSNDVIYNNIEKHNGRKNIERSIKRGIIIKEINDNSLSKFHELFIKMHKNEMETNAFADFQRLLDWWKLLKPLGYSGFLAEKDDVAVGALLFSYFNNHIIEGLVARSEEDYEKKLYSQDQIKWKIIEWGIENKMRFYNLAGFNPNPQSNKEKGIMRYKKKWGGKKFDFWIIKR